MSTRRQTILDLFARGFETHEQDEGPVDLALIRRNAVTDVLAPLKAFPQQRACFQRFTDVRQMTVCCPRRTGKTEGAWRFVLARMITRYYVVRVLAEELAIPTDNFLRPDDKPGLLAEIQRLGLADYCRVTPPRGYESGIVREVRFVWGSGLTVGEIRHSKSAARKRGGSAHLFWFDEAQDMGTLGETLRKVVRPMLGDHDGQILLTGTPGFAVGSYFHQAVHGDSFEHGQFFPWDNPFFGPDDAARWSRFFESCIYEGRDDYRLSDSDVERLRHLTRDERVQVATDTVADPDLAQWVDTLDPTLLQEYFGRWTKGGSQYVFDWHTDDIYWAQVEDGFTPTHGSLPVLAPTDPSELDACLAARVAALPETQDAWHAVIIGDPGTPNGPSGSASVVVVYNQSVRGARTLYSRVQETADFVDLLDHCAELVASLSRAVVEVDCIVGDFSGVGVKDTRWQAALAAHAVAPVPMHMAIKGGKHQQIHALNLILRRGLLLVLRGDILDVEGTNLRWKDGDGDRPVIDKWRPVTLANGHTMQPGDHALDSLRYGVPFIPTLRSSLQVSTNTLAQDRAATARKKTLANQFLRRFGRS